MTLKSRPCTSEHRDARGCAPIPLEAHDAARRRWMAQRWADTSDVTPRQRRHLTDDERDGIVLAVNSAFRKLKNLYTKVVPIFEDYGFTPPSAGVIARDLSEKIEKSIVQHCESFTKGNGHCDLARFDEDWEVKICKDSGLTINQSKVIAGENYIVVNYRANSIVKAIWVLWHAEDRFFSAKNPNANARSLNRSAAEPHMEVIFSAQAKERDG